jgi:hypothetical protein
LSGAVVIVIVVCGAGVQGIGRMRVVVMANYRNRAVGIIAVNARVLEILEEMMNPMRRRRSEKKDEERYDSQRDVRSRIKGNCFRVDHRTTLRVPDCSLSREQVTPAESYLPVCRY